MKFVLAQLLTGLLILGCKPTHQQVVGIYVEDNLRDSLELRTDQTYEYNETLINGKPGWTHGKWIQEKKNIRFLIDPRPLMGFGLSIRKESTAEHPQFNLWLGDSRKGIDIRTVAAFRKNALLDEQAISISGNTLELNADADSIEISTEDFKPITLSGDQIKKEKQSLQITPLERYYILDKFLFRYRNKQLKNINRKDSLQISIKFRKT